jgi:hypothetical protein
MIKKELVSQSREIRYIGMKFRPDLKIANNVVMAG